MAAGNFILLQMGVEYFLSRPQPQVLYSLIKVTRNHIIIELKYAFICGGTKIGWISMLSLW